MRKLVLAAACLAVPSGVAEAHARLEKAVPAVGSTVQTPPRALALTLSEDVEPVFSRIEVTDAGGKRVDADKPHPAADSRQILVVDLPALPAGTYTVTWRAVSADTHRTQGSFTFTVAP